MRRASEFIVSDTLGLVCPLAALLAAFSAPVRAQPEDAPAPGFIELSSYQARAVPAQRLTIDVRRGDPEIHRARLTYPDGFGVLGFAGEPGSPVASLEIDVGGDGTRDRVIPLHALRADLAYADTIPNGRLDPGLEPQLRVFDRTLELSLPFGGDGNPGTLTSGPDARVTMTLSAGVIRSPALGGPYRLTAQIVSVDPDTGDADDGANQAPTVRGFELPVVIAGPGLVRFRALSVDAFDVDPVERTRASFTIGGRFVLGKNSDGIDLKHEHVEVVLGPFRQTIPGTAFIRSSVGYVYRGAGPGITTLRIKRNGRFAFRAADLHLDLDQWRRLETPALGLRIGNDLGDAPLVPERKDR